MEKSLDRRRFLGASAAASSAVGLMAMTSSAGERVSANDTLTVAVLGVNGQGRNHVKYFAQQPGVEVACICDVDERTIPKAMEVAQQHQEKQPQFEKDFRRLLDDPSIDIISIATPNHLHAPITIMACAAGKHVYVEKPCSYTPEEGVKAVKAARQFSRVVHMGNQRRSRSHYIEAVEKLHAGAIGKVLISRTWYNSRRGSIGKGKEVPVPKELDYSLWQGPAPERPYKDNLIHYNWHWHWHWGNGELGNNGVHILDVARWGMNVDFPTWVTSTGGRFRYDDDQETPDTHSVSYHFGERMITWDGLSWSPYGPGGSRFGATFHGEAGTMSLHDAGYSIYDMQNKEVESVSRKGGDPEHYASFLKAIREGGRPSSDIEDAHKTTLLCHLGNIAQRVGRTLETDAQNGHIKNDPEAQQLWSREYRKGWELGSLA